MGTPVNQPVQLGDTNKGNVELGDYIILPLVDSD